MITSVDTTVDDMVKVSKDNRKENILPKLFDVRTQAKTGHSISEDTDENLSDD